MKYLTYKDMVGSMEGWEQKKFLVGGTSVRPGDALQKIITRLNARHVVEIGTGFGTSALAMAGCECVKTVTTFDIKDSIWPGYIARRFGLDHKINFIPAADSYDIYRNIILKGIYDLAFIDGAHIPPYAENDFNAVQHIGQALFDDAYSKHIRKILDDNGGIVIGKRFGYWNEAQEYTTLVDLDLANNDTITADGKMHHDYRYLNNL